jgi:purine-binding chemotaxis protein CheW
MTPADTMTEYVTAIIGGQLFGVPIARVQDVFVPDRLTQVPLAPSEIAGLLNVRGRILTVVNMWKRLDVERKETSNRQLALGVELHDESYGLLIDQIGEVLKVAAASREEPPINLDRKLAHVCTGVHRLDGKLMLVLDLDRILELGPAAKAA